jgi:dihydrofolate synthase/folylpolyglutamate synthase
MSRKSASTGSGSRTTTKQGPSKTAAGPKAKSSAKAGTKPQAPAAKPVASKPSASKPSTAPAVATKPAVATRPAVATKPAPAVVAQAAHHNVLDEAPVTHVPIIGVPAMRGSAPVRAEEPLEPKLAEHRTSELSKTEQTKARRGDFSDYSVALKWLHERVDLERLHTVQYSDEPFKLDRMRQLLEALGNPHEQVKCVHVAGTNGKGSTVAMVSAMLQACGYAVGQYVSPHLVDVRERVTINGAMPSEADFLDLMRRVAKAAGKLPFEPTFFELMTALSFVHFAEQAVDIAVVEVGLGGRLDCTNVITPLVSVVTSIDLDHTRILGKDVKSIAREKAGIFKAGVPALAFEPQPEVEAVFREVAAQVGAPLMIVNKDIEFSSRFCTTPDLGAHTRVCFYTRTTRLEHLPVPLPGEHQAANCGLALAAIDVLKSAGFSCPDDKISLGLMATKIRGRMELIAERPRVLVDGAHNPASVGTLMRCVGAHVPYDSMVCIFGCCRDKDMAGLLDKVHLGADKVIFTRAAGTPRAADPNELQRMFAERSGKMSQVARSLSEALEVAMRAVGREDLICITGSFYLVGEAMRLVGQRRHA